MKPATGQEFVHCKLEFFSEALICKFFNSGEKLIKLIPFLGKFKLVLCIWRMDLS